jgi:uncharacterized protein YcbX
MSHRLTQIYRYPIKSCRGESLQRSVVEPWGLAGDRRWMLVATDSGQSTGEAIAGNAVTARENPRLLLASPRPFRQGIVVGAPGMAELKVPAPNGGTLVPVSVWESELMASEADGEASAWFSELIRVRVRLVYLDDPRRRRPNPAYSRDTDRVSFADGYPLLLTSEGSLHRLNELIAEGPLAAEGPLPMTRFRPNVVVSGAPAWDEDQWRLLRIGDVVFRVSKGCDRCVLTTIDPDTARKGKEPIATLARHRKRDGKVWFGSNLIPHSLDAQASDAEIRIGDSVQILERL